ncbi:MAG TPA: hypothetical protein PLS84_04725 [Salinivirgaceae bacterium]|nr:hypothetical protein [Salinivirgaceae bacterium]
MDISGNITGVKYKVVLTEELKQIDIKQFNINEMPATCLLTSKKNTFAISKWVSPKRTRSYPFERVYNSLVIAKKITVIPIIKDEGAQGDRDFIQWDTVSLMSLLDVFVIFAYYDKAEINPRNKQKITNQQFNNTYILTKIKEIEQYHSSALHWNLNELNTNFHKIVDKAKSAYLKIEKTTNVTLHNISGIDKFKERIGTDVSLFMNFSREKAKQAQAREFVTKQPKESLSTLSKAKITITNYLGGQYFFTVDEVDFDKDTIYLIEGKHSKNSILPSKGDIKDGLLKLILYSNLTDVKVNGNKIKSRPVLLLTSSLLKGCVSSLNNKQELKDFLNNNNFSSVQKELIDKLMTEASKNKFIVKLQYSK